MQHVPGPAWVSVLVAVAFVLVAAYCAMSLVVHGRPWGRASGAEANHVLMAVAMVVMVLPAGGMLLPAVVGLALFSALGLAWLACLVVLRLGNRPLGVVVGGRRCCAHPAHLVLVNAAMAVMFAAMLPADEPAAGMAGMPEMAGHVGHAAGGSSPALAVGTAALAVYLVAHAVGSVVVLARSPRPVTAAIPVAAAVPVAVGSGEAVVEATPTVREPVVERLVSSARTQMGCQALMSAGMGLLLLPLV